MKWRQYLEVPKANGLFNPELVGFLPTCVSGRSYLPYNGSITLKFHTFTPRQVKIKWPRKAKLAVRMNASDCYTLLLYNLQSIQLCIGLSFLTSVLKSDYKDNQFNCISYGKTSIFLTQELIVVTHMSAFTKSQRWAPFWLSLWIAASPLNMQPTSRIWAQTDVEINLCISLNSRYLVFLS